MLIRGGLTFNITLMMIQCRVSEVPSREGSLEMMEVNTLRNRISTSISADLYRYSIDDSSGKTLYKIPELASQLFSVHVNLLSCDQQLGGVGSPTIGQFPYFFCHGVVSCHYLFIILLPQLDWCLRTWHFNKIECGTCTWYCTALWMSVLLRSVISTVAAAGTCHAFLVLHRIFLSDRCYLIISPRAQNGWIYSKEDIYDVNTADQYIPEPKKCQGPGNPGSAVPLSMINCRRRNRVDNPLKLATFLG